MDVTVKVGTVIYQRPGTVKLGKIVSDTKIYHVIDESTGWYKIDWSNGGWVAASECTVLGEPAPAPEPTPSPEPSPTPTVQYPDYGIFHYPDGHTEKWGKLS